MKQENSLKPINAKKFMLDNWQMYNIGLKSQQEMLELLNIFQANGTCFENVYEAWQNAEGYTRIMGIFGRWDTAADLIRAIMDTNYFYTDKEFIEFILEQYQDMKEDGEEDPAEVIRHWTFEGLATDTVIWKTEDGYVRRIYC